MTTITRMTSDAWTYVTELDPGPAALSAVGAALVLMVLLGLTVRIVRRARRGRSARAPEAARSAARGGPAAAASHRDPAIRRSTPPPLFATRDAEPDVLTAGLNGATDALAVLGAMEAADREQPAELGPPLPRWLGDESDAEPGPTARPEGTVRSERGAGRGAGVAPQQQSEPVAPPVREMQPVPEAQPVSASELAPAPAPVPAPAPAPEPELAPAPVPAPALVPARASASATAMLLPAVSGARPMPGHRPDRRTNGSVAPWMVAAGAAALLLMRRRRRLDRQG